MSDKITLPGDIPGLLRRGAPVIVQGLPGVVLSVSADGVWAAVDNDVTLYAPGDVTLDLAWVLASDGWCPPSVEGGDYTGADHGKWFVGDQECNHEDGYVEPDTNALICKVCEAATEEVVPALAALDLADPDVDRRALAACCLHVAGRTP